jgi:Cell division septal protein
MFRAAFLLVTMGTLMVLLFSVIYTVFFRITEIEVEGITRYTKERIISASGTGIDGNLYSFNSDTARENIMASCPFVKDVTVTRTPPNKVTFEIVEDLPVFYVNVFNEHYLLSASMRVLGKTSVGSADMSQLIQLKLPLINFAVAGIEIKFAESKNEKYIQETVTDVVGSPLAERLDSVDLRDRYNLTMVSDKKYKLLFGTVNEVALRLKLAEKVFQDKMFNSENKALIDLTQLNETSVIIDNQIVLE